MNGRMIYCLAFLLLISLACQPSETPGPALEQEPAAEMSDVDQRLEKYTTVKLTTDSTIENPTNGVGQFAVINEYVVGSVLP